MNGRKDFIMTLTVFAKKRQVTEDGKARIFYTYLTKLTKKDGTEITTAVKFPEDCPAPKADICPCNIDVERQNMNYNEKTETNEDGVSFVSRVLWVKKYSLSDVEYIDHSMDDFVD